MSELSDLYQEVILDHNRKPRNFRAIDAATASQEGYNPLCGDRLTLYLNVENGTITDVAFQGSGCAISKASASLMTDSVKGKSLAEAETLYGKFHELLTGPPDVKVDPEKIRSPSSFTKSERRSPQTGLKPTEIRSAPSIVRKLWGDLL